MVTCARCFLTEESCPSCLLSRLLPAALLGLLVIILVRVFFIRTKYKRGEFSLVWSCEVQTQRGRGRRGRVRNGAGRGWRDGSAAGSTHGVARALVTPVSGDQVPSPDPWWALGTHRVSIHGRQNTYAHKRIKNLKRILRLKKVEQ